MAETATPDVLEKIRKQVRIRSLAGASNNSKWNELIAFIREQSDWHPTYRSKSVFGEISDWDVEWFYHLPFPFVGVEWLDIGLKQFIHVGKLLPPKIIDHSSILFGKLQEIGFEFETSNDVVRIWGYLPKNYDDFPPS